MNPCDRFEKLITLSDLGDLTAKERDEIAQHTAICPKCMEKAKQMQGYFSFIQSLQREQPRIDNPSSLTDSIIGSISQLKVNPSVVRKSNQFGIQPFYLRVAASILLFIMAGFYVQQSMYVSKMDSSLRLTYQIKNANRPLVNSYNECLSFSEDFIRDQLVTDTRYLHLLVKFSQQYPIRGYRSFASAVCLRSSTEFNNADLEMKKRMVIEILISSINQNR